MKSIPYSKYLEAVKSIFPEAQVDALYADDNTAKVGYVPQIRVTYNNHVYSFAIQTLASADHHGNLESAIKGIRTDEFKLK